MRAATTNVANAIAALFLVCTIGPAGSQAGDGQTEDWRKTAEYLLSPDAKNVYRWGTDATYRFIGSASDYLLFVEDLDWVGAVINEHDPNFSVDVHHHLDTDLEAIKAITPVLESAPDGDNRHSFGFTYQSPDGSRELTKDGVTVVIAPRGGFKINGDLGQYRANLVGFREGYIDCIVIVRSVSKRIFSGIIMIAAEVTDPHKRECIYEETIQSFGLMRDHEGTQFFTFDDNVFPNRRENDRILISALYATQDNVGSPLEAVMQIFEDQTRGMTLKPIN